MLAGEYTLDGLMQSLRCIYNMLGTGIFQLLTRAKSPADAYGVYAGVAGCFDINGRVAHHNAVIQLRARLLQDNIHKGGVGLQGYSFAIAADVDKVDVGEELADKFFGSGLELVGRHG